MQSGFERIAGLPLIKGEYVVLLKIAMLLTFPCTDPEARKFEVIALPY